MSSISRQSLQGRNIKYLNLYPALKQVSKDKIDFASSNTRADQLYLRKLLVKRVCHYHEFNAFKTIVLDSRYVQKARRNLGHAKSFKHVQLHISEPAVFDLVYKVMRQLRKKTVDTLTIHFEVKENNLNIGRLVQLASIFSTTRIVNFSFDGAKEETCLKILPSISLMLEKSAFLENQKVSVTFRGIFAFLTNHIAAPMRYWREIHSVQVTPSNVYGPIQLPVITGSPALRTANNLKMTFEFLKKFEPEALRNLVNNLNLLQKIQTLTLVLSRFELVKDRPDILGDFIQNLHLQKGLKLIIYYVKYQKMNFEKIFSAIEAQADQIKELTLGHLVIKEEIKTPLVQMLAKLDKLESLKIYWEIKDSLESQQKNNLWEFFNHKQNLESLDIILTSTSTVLEENNTATQKQNLENSLKTLLQSLAKLPKLKSLRFVLPEIQLDIGSLVNDMVMESASLKNLKLECDEYNLNYLSELREIQKIKNLRVQIFTGEKDSLSDFETTQDFKLITFFNSYDHFTQIHQQFYLHNI